MREIVGPEPEADFDAHLVVGEFPALVVSWGRAPDPAAFLRRELPDPTSPLVVVGERSVAAEFPPDAQVRLVLSAIGAGERTFSAIAAASGLPKVGLQRALDLLVRKRVVERLVPLSARPSRLTRYVVGDPDLRFWLRYVAPGLEEILRGRGELVVERVLGSWVEYCGRAIEPVVRASIERMLPAEAVGGARYVVSYWTRSGDVEVALVGVDRRSAPRLVGFVGGIEWRQRAAFAQEDLDGLIEQRSRVPGGARSTTLVAVSRSGFRARGEYVALGPEELLLAWRADPGGRGVE